MLEPFTTATANRSTVLPCSARVSPACGVHTLFAVNLCGRGQFAIDLLAHLGFKRMVSCSFRDKRMRLKTRAYGTLSLPEDNGFQHCSWPCSLIAGTLKFYCDRVCRVFCSQCTVYQRTGFSTAAGTFYNIRVLL